MKGKVLILMLGFLAISYLLYEYKGNPKELKDKASKNYTTGTITNQNSNPVSKATVYLLGSDTKTISDNDGEYKIEATIGDELVVTHPKYKNHSVEIKDKTEDIQLQPKE